MPVISFKRNKFTTGSVLTSSICPYALPYLTRKAEWTRSLLPRQPNPPPSLFSPSTFFLKGCSGS